MSHSSIAGRAVLNNGVEMPYFGLGVFKAGPGSETVGAVRHALDAGYRLIDTAAIYGNEKEVGQAVRECALAREEIFVTTKLWNDSHGYDQAIAAFNDSLGRLGLDYVDLYLIHWPVEKLRGDTWRALVALSETGKCRSIGVSNYTVRHLEELLSESPVVPVVNQVEFSPFLYQRELLEFCRSHGIQLEAYCSLVRGQRFDDPVLQKMASTYGKTPAQILIRWTLEHDVVVIPKSVSPARIVENANVFDFSISAEDMAELDGLNEDLRITWDPTDVV